MWQSRPLPFKWQDWFASGGRISPYRWQDNRGVVLLIIWEATRDLSELDYKMLIFRNYRFHFGAETRPI